MTKVAVVITDAYSYAGTENVCNYMTDCLASEAVIDVLSLKGGGDTFYPYSNVRKIESFDNEKKPLLALRKKIIENDYDFVFVVSMGKLSFLFRFLFFFDFGIKNRTKFISCEHIAFDSFNTGVKILKAFALLWYDAVVVLTDKDRIKLSKLGINSLKINNPINYHNYIKKERSFTALAVGRLNYQKGFDRLLDIWASFVSVNNKWILNIAGDGELLSDLKNKAEELNITTSVNFLGKVNDLTTFYRESDVLLMTSRYEGLPMVLLESKSWSLPVIAYDCPTGPREIINHEVDGFLVNDNDRESFISYLNAISNSNETLYNLSQGTIYTYKEFDSNVIKNKWIDLIRKKDTL